MLTCLRTAAWQNLSTQNHENRNTDVMMGIHIGAQKNLRGVQQSKSIPPLFGATAFESEDLRCGADASKQD